MELLVIEIVDVLLENLELFASAAFAAFLAATAVTARRAASGGAAGRPLATIERAAAGRHHQGRSQNSVPQRADESIHLSSPACYIFMKVSMIWMAAGPTRTMKTAGKMNSTSG